MTDIILTAKAARVNAGYDQKEVAIKLGITKQTLSSYERGETIPDVLMGKEMAKLYGVPIDNIKFGK